ncbi:SDR family NAD(P)-dependent oxidoreductase [Sphingobium aromaticivastans]|uniref:SDR family NAD(P)-dependent oxidoreductase n=1 Tax=Sphingobium aromaticivastans TaxID=1778665 RepID=UPI00301820D7
MNGGELAGKVAVITGAASGIGQGIALGFLREGARVVVADLDAARCAETARLAGDEGFGDRLLCVGGDVTVDRDVASMVLAAREHFGRIDIMVNNAGGPGAMAPMLEIAPEEFDATFALLVRSVFLGVRHAGRAMREQGQGGVILNTASIAARACGYSPSLYASAKAAVVQLTAVAAAELAAWRIRVNCVSPGMILVPGFVAGGITAETLAQNQPWPEAGLPADVAAAMVFLASDRCRFTTGSDLVVDGGLLGQGPQMLKRLYGL